MADAEARKRLDQLLVARGLAETRSRARDLIKLGLVRVGGTVIDMPAFMASSDAALRVEGDAGRYVSRGAFKLIAALDAFGFEARDRNALDLGASTGGFTQVLLERGAAHVTALDVGRGQLSYRLRDDPRVTVLESTDARDLTADLVPGPVSAIVADVSFISLTKVLPAALKLAAPGCWLVALVKPQFEVGPDTVGRGGIVRDGATRAAAVDNVAEWLKGQPGWRVTGVIESPIKGADGNIESLIGAEFSS